MVHNQLPVQVVNDTHSWYKLFSLSNRRHESLHCSIVFFFFFFFFLVCEKSVHVIPLQRKLLQTNETLGGKMSFTLSSLLFPRFEVLLI